ncbi:DUF4362 domain-containing protein [Paenibacillus sp. Soil724D2]|uniref:DUF4362 domain-containing protein n=1 Tax=Paenibacillus sp. (strain Soil724D2) TaxID=1736392 RepID=UPI0009E888B3|nr:DUF4362 domain-containing protein [Paenibacillus sp. Soil724D2]
MMNTRRQCVVFCLITFLLISCNKNDGRNVVSDFPKVSKPYHSEQAVKNGDVVNIHGTYFNIEKWKTFLGNLESNQPSKVRITQYTVEGDPIFYELTYDGNLVHYTFDNSMDAFGSDLRRPSTICKSIEKKKAEQGMEGFILKGCDNSKTGDTFWFVDQK